MSFSILEKETFGDMCAVAVCSPNLSVNGRLWFNRKTDSVVRFYSLEENSLDLAEDFVELIPDEQIMQLAQAVIEKVCK